VQILPSLHLSKLVQEPQPRATAQDALNDYRTIIRREASGKVEDAADLLSFRESVKEKKSFGGNDR
jgi:hypothetical protein